MPNYGAQVPLTSLSPGDSMYLFNAETPTAPQASVAFARGFRAGGLQAEPITFTANWAVAPTAVLNIQGSNDDVDENYVTLGDITNTSPGYYADYGGFQYYRVQLASQSAGGALTVKVQR